MRRSVVILTKSAKHGGYCVAGLDVDTGQWLRLVSADRQRKGALTDDDMRYRNGDIADCLDVVSLNTLGEEPSRYQPENILIDDGEDWQKLGQWPLRQVMRLHEPERRPFIFWDSSPYLCEAEMDMLDHSLTMAEVEELILIRNPYRKMKTSFFYCGRLYENISMTDISFYGAAHGTRIQRALLVASLPEVDFQGCYYKFIAKIFPLS